MERGTLTITSIVGISLILLGNLVIAPFWAASWSFVYFILGRLVTIAGVCLLGGSIVIYSFSKQKRAKKSNKLEVNKE